MKILLTIIAIFGIAFACGSKVEVEDSEHEVEVKFGGCEVFEDIEEQRNCMRVLIEAAADKEPCE